MLTKAGRNHLNLLHSRNILRSLALPIGDFFAMIACFSIGGLINLSYDNITEARAIILLGLVFGIIIVFQQLGHYNRRRQFWQEVGDIISVVVVCCILDSAILYLADINFSRAWVLTSWSLVIFVVPTVRLSLKNLGLNFGAWHQPAVIIGTGPLAQEAAEAHHGDVHAGYDLIAFIDPCNKKATDASQAEHEETIHVKGNPIPVYSLAENQLELPSWLGSHHVIVALDVDKIARQEALIEKLYQQYRHIDIISPVRGLPINTAKTAHFFTHDILSIRISNNLARPWSQMLKRIFDICAAIGIIVLLAPIMLIIAAKLYFEGGNVIFGHQRVGKDGNLFKCLKFRSMVPNSQEMLAHILKTDPEKRAEWEKDFKLKDDPRITRFGKFLRKSSLDELPQLFNVLRGEMSLVGPRPVVPDELERYGEAKSYYLEVRPGLTGLWQISGRSDLDYDERVNLDTWYVRNWTLWYDILILFKTLIVVPTRSGAY